MSLKTTKPKRSRAKQIMSDKRVNRNPGANIIVMGKYQILRTGKNIFDLFLFLQNHLFFGWQKNCFLVCFFLGGGYKCFFKFTRTFTLILLYLCKKNLIILGFMTCYTNLPFIRMVNLHQNEGPRI